MSHEIHDILKRLEAVTEGATTPVSVKHGLNKQQKSVPQLPALFKPKNISPVLKSKADHKHPMAGYMVGSAESKENTKPALEGYMASVEEDMVSKVRADLNRYLDKLSNEYSDDDGYKERKFYNIDKLSQKQEIDHDLMDKAVNAVEKGEVEDAQMSEPVECMMLEDGSVIEIHGNDDKGFEIHRLGRVLPTRFPNLGHAKMAIDIFRSKQKQKQQEQNQDYIEEK